MRSFYLTGIFLFAFLNAQNFAFAQNIGKYCEEARNKNDLVKCLNASHEDVKNRLSLSFEKIAGSLAPEDMAAFKQGQQDWINYRESQCAWEIGLEQDSSLKRVQELYCRVRLTEQRLDVLDIAQTDVQAEREYQGIPPRWRNILNENYGDIYWRSNSLIGSDLNCDERPENVLLGIRQSNSVEEKRNLGFVVGVVSQTSAGLTSVRTFDLPSSKKNLETGEVVLCGEDVTMRLVETRTDNSICPAQEIEIVSSHCGAFAIRARGDEFEMVDDINNNNVILKGKRNE